jgi:ribosomal protein S18 acetylase RimI-like enzyme
MNIREISADEAGIWVEYCEKEWEHGRIVDMVTRADIEKLPPPGITRSHLVVEVDDIAAGLTITIDEEKSHAFYGAKHWLDMWVVSHYRGNIEKEIIRRCDNLLQDRGIHIAESRIPDHQSRFTHLFREAGYQDLYKEDTFIRETKAPIDDIILSYYEQAQEKVDLRVSRNIEEDIETYISLVNEISKDVDNMSPLEYDRLHSSITEGRKHMIGVWIFAEVDKTPGGFIGGLVSFQKLQGKNQVVGRIINNGVLKQYRGMGIGTALYVKMIEEMKKWNTCYILDYMVMEDNAPERTLLKELGFEPAQKHLKIQKMFS